MPTLVVTDPCYWLASDSASVAHFGYAGVGAHISTGQPQLTTYSTMAALVAVLVAGNFPVMDGSTHEVREWYLWDTKAAADAALAAINSNPAFPALIPDPATGERTVTVTCWCTLTQEMADGKWGFKRIPTALLDEWQISQESREAWFAAFQPAIAIDPSLALV
jgi:hypothetical protein